VIRRIASTLLGGYRFVYDEADDDSSLPFHLHLLQILIYCIVPAIVIILTLVLPKDRPTAVVIAGLVAFSLNTVVQLISYCVQRRSNQQTGLAGIKELEDDEACCGKKAYLFLFPARQSLTELLVCVLLTGVYTSLMTYFMHGATLDALNSHLTIYDKQVFWGLTLATIVLSSYSLLSRPIPESTPYMTNTDAFSLFSSHYQRVGYSVIILGAVCIAEFSSKYHSTINGINRYFQIAYILNFVFLLLQMAGMLSSPMVTLAWFAEQVDIHVLGATPRASDSRIAMSFVINSGIVIAMYFANNFSIRLVNGTILGVILAWVFSHNVLLNVGISKPFKVVNDRAKYEELYSQIAFGMSPAQKGKLEAQSKAKNLVTFGVFTLLDGAACLAPCLILIQNYSWLLSDLARTRNISSILFIIAFALSILAYLISAIYKRALWRVIPCCAREGSPVILSRLLQALIKACLSLAYTGLLVLEPNWNSILLHYRAYNRLFHNPLAATLESFLLFLYLQSPSKGSLPSFLVLFLIHIGLHRSMLLCNKCLYVVVSLTTAYRNKKQRFASQSLCFLLEFTVLLPLFLLALLYSTLVNSATVPFLGFAYFLPGYPKPQRAWSALAPVAANGNDQRSDGHLYQAMMPQLEKELARLFHGDPFLFRAGSFYLLKNEKMVALLQVVERGNNFLAYQLKGTEL